MIYGAAGAKMAVVSIDEEKPWKRSVLLPLSPWKGIYGVSLAIIRPKAQPNLANPTLGPVVKKDPF